LQESGLRIGEKDSPEGEEEETQCPQAATTTLTSHVSDTTQPFQAGNTVWPMLARQQCHA